MLDCLTHRGATDLMPAAKIELRGDLCADSKAPVHYLVFEIVRKPAIQWRFVPPIPHTVVYRSQSMRVLRSISSKKQVFSAFAEQPGHRVVLYLKTYLNTNSQWMGSTARKA